MSKKKGMFSWLGLGGQQEKEVKETTPNEETNSEIIEQSAVESSTQSNEGEIKDDIDKESIDESINTVVNDLPEPEQRAGFFTRLKQSLSKTRQNIGGGLVDLFRGKKIDDDLFEELETNLLMADVGVDTTTKIIASLTDSANRKQLKDAEAQKKR